MLAIITEFMPSTDTRPARIKAFTCNGHKVIISVDYDLDGVQRHMKAAQKLIREQMKHFGDCTTLTYGGSPKGYVFCKPTSTVTLEA